MKTITISVDDETYRYCQRNAEAAGIPVEEWVTSRLAGITPPRASSKDVERQRETWNRIQADIDARANARGDELRTARKLTREELHDRGALR
ncbi:MAG: hypothetical protein F4X64_06575 [Chloroflexi bacterium]|nr:hypothetical protein [Chloroflexota bacterium]